MNVLLHSSTHLPAPPRAASASHTRALEIWLLTAFLFMLLIVGRLTSQDAIAHRHAQMPASTLLLRKSARPHIITPGQLAPFIEPIVLR